MSQFAESKKAIYACLKVKGLSKKRKIKILEELDEEFTKIYEEQKEIASILASMDEYTSDQTPVASQLPDHCITSVQGTVQVDPQTVFYGAHKLMAFKPEKRLFITLIVSDVE